MEDSKLIAYYILQHKYLKQCGLDANQEEYILKDYHKFFPENWEIEYNVDKKIELISLAIKNNQNLIDVADAYLRANNIVR